MDIQGLRDKILQLAIQGKLVEQDENDEPASALVQRIKEERDKLVREKKIKKPKKLLPIEEEEKPFEIPDGWEWVKINDICNVKGGKRIPKGYNFSDEKTEYVYLRVTDMKCRTILDDDIRYINEEVYNMIKNYTISSDDLYITIAGTIGAVGKIPSKYNNMNLTENASKLSFYKKSECSLDYIMYSIESNLVQNQFKNKVNKMAQPKLALREIESTVIPLPPFAEQKRIVEKVDELFALIDEFDSNKEDLLEVINLTRKQVLQEAIQGKLVEQNPEDEPAYVLLGRIKEERDKLVKEKKIRKPKKLPPIEEEEKPFEIPGSWEWVRLGEICYNLGQKKPNKKFTYIDVSSIDNKTGEVGDKLNILTPEEAPSRARKLVSTGTIIYSTVRPYLLNIAIIDGYFEFEPIVSTAFAVMNTFSGVNNKYLFYYLRSNSFTNYVDSQMVGMAYPAINDSNLFKGLFPLPPIEEQKRIVEKVDIIMDMLDELEKTIME